MEKANKSRFRVAIRWLWLKFIKEKIKIVTHVDSVIEGMFGMQTLWAHKRYIWRVKQI